MEKRNKHWRIEQRNRVYAGKMRLFAAWGNPVILHGQTIQHPRWIELYQANWNPVWKSVRTPCSCWMCRGEAYDRCKHRSETRNLLNASLANLY